jgi:putative flippase GtrA
MQGAITSVLSLWHRFTLTRYFAASVIALLFDLAVFWALVVAGLSTALASAVGYAAGIVIHWLISANIVFPGKARQGGALILQRGLFLGSALLGLGITVGVVTIATNVGGEAIFSKALAVFVSFFTVYWVRKLGVFQ